MDLEIDKSVKEKKRPYDHEEGRNELSDAWLDGFLDHMFPFHTLIQLGLGVRSWPITSFITHEEVWWVCS